MGWHWNWNWDWAKTGGLAASNALWKKKLGNPPKIKKRTPIKFLFCPSAIPTASWPWQPGLCLWLCPWRASWAWPPFSSFFCNCTKPVSGWKPALGAAFHVNKNYSSHFSEELAKTSTFCHLGGLVASGRRKKGETSLASPFWAWLHWRLHWPSLLAFLSIPNKQGQPGFVLRAGYEKRPKRGLSP